MTRRRTYDKYAYKKQGSVPIEAAACTGCGRQKEVHNLVWTYAARPTCTFCGGLLEPCKVAQKSYPELVVTDKSKPKRTCANCGAFLRAGNKEQYCAPCERQRHRCRVLDGK
jgi:hypothetical protein